MTPAEKLCSRSWRVRNSSWLLSPILAVGMGTGASFIYIGVKARKRQWIIAGMAYAAMLAAYLIWHNAVSDGVSGKGTATGAEENASWILIITWVAGIVHGLLANREWLRWKAHRPSEKWYTEGLPEEQPLSNTSAPDADIDKLLGRGPAHTARQTASASVVNVNTADAAALESLGLLPEQAAKVISERNADGLYANPSELMTRAGFRLMCLLRYKTECWPKYHKIGATGRRPGGRRLDI